MLITEMIHFRFYCQTYEVWALLSLCAVMHIINHHHIILYVIQRATFQANLSISGRERIDCKLFCWIGFKPHINAMCFIGREIFSNAMVLVEELSLYGENFGYKFEFWKLLLAWLMI